ncbi:MAG: YhdP family protein [Burkholderiales bacterium]
MAIRARVLIRRIFLYLPLFLAFAATGFVLALRLWILPNLDHWRGEIAGSVSHSIKQKVILGRLSANWEHWHPQLYIQSVRLLDQTNRTTLFFSDVRTELSWTSLLYGEVRLARLSVSNLVLSMQRDKNGAIYLAGIVINGPQHKNLLGDWLLNQHEIRINNATIAWNDYLLGAPELIVDRINVDLINHGKVHKFRLNASPPPSVSGSVDIAGKLTGKYLEDRASWHGWITAKIPYTNLAQWQPWITLPYGISSGYGNFALQAQIAGKQLIAATATTSLRNLSIQFKPDLPALRLLDLSGQAEWKRRGAAQALTLRQLNMHTADRAAIVGLDAALQLLPATAKTPAVGDIAINTISLQNLSRLASCFPLAAAQQTLITQRQPKGTLSDIRAQWQGDPAHPQYYHIQSEFSGAGLEPTPTEPGFSGLSGHVDADTSTGKLMLDSHNATLDLTNILFVPHVVLDSVKANVDWTKTAAGYSFRLTDASFSNPDAAGSAAGTYQWVAGQRGIIGLSGTLARGDARAVYRYLPLALKPPAYNWLKAALLGGKVDHATFRLQGDLDKFPFLNDQNGLLDVDVQFSGGILQPGPEYPAIDHIDGDLKFFGSSMTIRSDSARLYNAHLSDIGVAIPDLFARDKEILYINGGGRGDLNDLIRFANNSPVSQVTGNLTKGAEGIGKAQVLLHLQLPLHDMKHPQIHGSVDFLNDNITPNKPVPSLEAVNGKLHFTQDSIHIRNINLRLFGGPAVVATQTLPDGVERINLSGQLTAPGIAPYLPVNLAGKISGNTHWQGKIDLIRGQTVPPLEFDSDLSGIAIDLPRPFNKAAAEPIPLQINTKPAGTGEEQVDLHYGNMVDAALLRATQENGGQIKRAAVNFGGTARVPTSPGLWISGHVPALDFEGWNSQPSGTSPSLLPQKIDINVTIGQFDLFQRQFNDIRLHAVNNGPDWQADVSSAVLQGKINWLPHGAPPSTDKLIAHFKNLNIPDAQNTTAAAQPGSTALPELVLDVDDLMVGKRHLGELRVRATPIPGGLRFRQIALDDSDSKLQMSALWHPHASPETVATIRLNIKNIGHFFDRFGHPGTIKGGTAIIDGQADWDGTPVDITLTSLAGNFTLTAENGQFLKIDPGAAKLLGVLSLQALPRHIGLDFSDIFSEGFAFEDISATMQLNRGIIYSKDFLMNGPAASVRMNGTIDMNAQTQQLHASISPKLNGTVALASSLLGGPVVALGVYAAQELLKNPFGNAVSFDYTITGPWADPVVKKDE